MKQKQLYTLGFFFDKTRKNVALIEKQRPDWQKGFLNGIGGKIEPFETSLDCMIREFKEETDVKVTNWNHFMNKVGDDFEVYCYYAFDDNDSFFNLKTTTDEKVIFAPINRLREFKTLSNLQWMIPMIFEANLRFPINVKYKK